MNAVYVQMSHNVADATNIECRHVKDQNIALVTKPIDWRPFPAHDEPAQYNDIV